mmetsp:Transcript_25614/g.39413  ORF Transcript_25614/g.39413 Transcript_25614/m.39413 type:complete len:179 (+) Transcript_25614:737-1273(+)
MEYIGVEKDYFRSFIEGGKVDEYIERKSQNGVWGDDIEIQAMSEIYNLAIEIYAYSTKPMKTFHEAQVEDDDQIAEKPIPLRLSYHGGSHYNCIVAQDWNEGHALIKGLQPGQLEEEHISSLKEPVEPIDEQALKKALDSGSKEEECKETSIVKQVYLQADPQKLRKMIQQSREEFET